MVKDWLEKEFKKKEGVMLELSNRVSQWHDAKCPACNASWRGCGPHILNSDEVDHDGAHSFPDEEFVLLSPKMSTMKISRV